jgi:catechol 2,3-dioxygenase-like lactoylglutathione lyase family enzyme
VATSPNAQLTFTKLVVDDLDAMADFYCTVFGLHPVMRERLEKGIGGEPIEQISLSQDPALPYGPLTLLKYEGRPAPPIDEMILGFTTNDLPPLLDRVKQAGGSLCSDVRENPAHKIRVAFARDPEGHLCEIVEMQS